ncbi:cobalt-precorrin-6A reductase [Conexibacter woesei]|uniref:cobalt-precorrin-6A reductase n=1 Tax=Conexibacter woesei TaxID=191495 RepID=UPI000405F043|nr:cobalt-precorrin-6A reductase [Conexibacter woesei]
MTVLVLGGTREARELATRLVGEGVAVVTALAGRTEAPLMPPGEVRIGGFGGPEGLARWLTERRVEQVVDATHPFAARISQSARTACAAAGVPLETVERAGYEEGAGDDWRWVDSLEEAARAAEGHRVLLTTGRLGLDAFTDARSAWFLIRCITRPDTPLPPGELLLERGPFTLDGELDLIDRYNIDMVITKDSGGPAPKLEAARCRGLPVVIVRRPEATA